MIIRRAEASDVNAICELALASWPQEENVANKRDWEERILSGEIIFCGLRDEDIIGVVSAEDLDTGVDGLNILLLFVHPKHRNLGLASELVRTVTDLADLRLIKTFASVNTIGPVSLYEMLGFFKDEEIPHGSGTVYYGMTRPALGERHL